MSLVHMIVAATASRAARFAGMGMALAVVFAAPAFAADPPASAPPAYPASSAIPTGVTACATQLSNCQSVCSQALPPCVNKCDADYKQCEASGGDQPKK